MSKKQRSKMFGFKIATKNEYSFNENSHVNKIGKENPKEFFN